MEDVLEQMTVVAQSRATIDGSFYNWQLHVAKTAEQEPAATDGTVASTESQARSVCKVSINRRKLSGNVELTIHVAPDSTLAKDTAELQMLFKDITMEDVRRRVRGTFIRDASRHSNAGVSSSSAAGPFTPSDAPTVDDAAVDPEEAAAKRLKLDAVRPMADLFDRMSTCPICFTQPIPPPIMAVCDNEPTRHVVCGDCFPKLAPRRCMVCRGGDFTVKQRNHMLEAMIAESMGRPPCQYGCGELVGYHELIAHRETCVSKPRPCPLCQIDVAPADFVSHLRSTHGGIFFTGDYCVSSAIDFRRNILRTKYNYRIGNGPIGNAEANEELYVSTYRSGAEECGVYKLRATVGQLHAIRNSYEFVMRRDNQTTPVILRFCLVEHEYERLLYYSATVHHGARQKMELRIRIYASYGCIKRDHTFYTQTITKSLELEWHTLPLYDLFSKLGKPEIPIDGHVVVGFSAK